MSGYLHDSILDLALAGLSGSRTLHILPAGTYADRAAVLAATLGNKALTVGAAQDGDTSGRKVTIPAITDGAVTATGTAAPWALIDGTNYLAGQDLAATQSVTSGNAFTLAATDIELPDPA
jgi:hypothetical protein